MCSARRFWAALQGRMIFPGTGSTRSLLDHRPREGERSPPLCRSCLTSIIQSMMWISSSRNRGWPICVGWIHGKGVRQLFSNVHIQISRRCCQNTLPKPPKSLGIFRSASRNPGLSTRASRAPAYRKDRVMRLEANKSITWLRSILRKHKSCLK